MNLILHQYKTDVRHFGALIVGYCAACLELAFVGAYAQLSLDLRNVFGLPLMWGIVAGAALLINRSLQADAVESDSAFWKTRPLSRPQLFAAKVLFILTAILLPWLLTHAIVWITAGLSAGQAMQGLAETLLFSFCLILFIATVSAAKRTLPQSLGLGTGLLFGLAFWSFVVSKLDSQFGFHSTFFGPDARHFEIWTSRNILCLLTLVAFGAAAWTWQMFQSRSRIAIAILATGLFATPLIMTVSGLNFFGTTEPDPEEIKLTTITNTPPEVRDGNSQLLWSHFVLDHLPANHIAAVTLLQGTLKEESGVLSLSVGYRDHGATLRRFSNFDTHRDFFNGIKRRFPDDTLWFGSFNTHLNTSLPGVSQVDNKRNPTGRFEGFLDVDLVKIEKLAEVPLSPDSHQLADGLQLTVRHALPTTSGIKVKIVERFTRPLLKPDATYGNAGASGGQCFYVLHQPESGEAFPWTNDGSKSHSPGFVGSLAAYSREFEFPYSAVRARLSGVTREEWMAKARLVVFRPRYRQTIRRTFNETNYLFKSSRIPSRPESLETRAHWQKIQTSEVNSDSPPAAIEAHLDLLLSYEPRSISSQQGKILRNKLQSIGRKNLPRLLERLPTRERLWDMAVESSIQQLATDEDLRALIEGYRREPRLASMFRRKTRLAAARPAVLDNLPRRDRVLDYDEMAIAASAKDPATYLDLAWHARHAERGYDTILTELSQCPDFDLNEVINYAWRRARLGLVHDYNLSSWAMTMGRKDAFHAAALRLEEQMSDSSRKQLLARFQKIVAYPGPDAELQPWLLANLGQFDYDAAQKKFVLR